MQLSVQLVPFTEWSSVTIVRRRGGEGNSGNGPTFFQRIFTVGVFIHPVLRPHFLATVVAYRSHKRRSNFRIFFSGTRATSAGWKQVATIVLSEWVLTGFSCSIDCPLKQFCQWKFSVLSHRTCPRTFSSLIFLSSSPFRWTEKPTRSHFRVESLLRLDLDQLRRNKNL